MSDTPSSKERAALLAVKAAFDNGRRREMFCDLSVLREAEPLVLAALQQPRHEPEVDRLTKENARLQSIVTLRERAAQESNPEHNHPHTCETESDCAACELDYWIAQAKKARAADEPEANQYALNLLNTLVDKFGRPEGFKPEDDMLGKLLQIDNVVAGLLARAALPPKACQCWEIVNALIKPGELPGNGTDKTAERNGIILAANTLLHAGAAPPPPSDEQRYRELVDFEQASRNLTGEASDSDAVRPDETSCSRCSEERQAGNTHCHYCGREWLDRP